MNELYSPRRLPEVELEVQPSLRSRSFSWARHKAAQALAGLLVVCCAFVFLSRSNRSFLFSRGFSDLESGASYETTNLDGQQTAHGRRLALANQAIAKLKSEIAGLAPFNAQHVLNQIRDVGGELHHNELRRELDRRGRETRIKFDDMRARNAAELKHLKMSTRSSREAVHRESNDLKEKIRNLEHDGHNRLRSIRRNVRAEARQLGSTFEQLPPRTEEPGLKAKERGREADKWREVDKLVAQEEKAEDDLRTSQEEKMAALGAAEDNLEAEAKLDVRALTESIRENREAAATSLSGAMRKAEEVTRALGEAAGGEEKEEAAVASSVDDLEKRVRQEEDQWNATAAKVEAAVRTVRVQSDQVQETQEKQVSRVGLGGGDAHAREVQSALHAWQDSQEAATALDNGQVEIANITVMYPLLSFAKRLQRLRNSAGATQTSVMNVTADQVGNMLDSLQDTLRKLLRQDQDSGREQERRLSSGMQLSDRKRTQAEQDVKSAIHDGLEDAERTVSELEHRESERREAMREEVAKRVDPVRVRELAGRERVRRADEMLEDAIKTQRQHASVRQPFLPRGSSTREVTADE